MRTKKKIVLIPSAYNHRVMGDVENFIDYYKDSLDVYLILDKIPSEEAQIENVQYVKRRTAKAEYLEVTADYVIDAGTISGSNKLSMTQKRISVWHGIPYKKMFADLSKEHVVSAIDYAGTIDLMVSPSEWYTERFLRQSMQYVGEVLETAVSRTDSLFLNEEKKAAIKEELGIPDNKKILLYAPTFRVRGAFSLPFSAKHMQAALGDDWVIVVKLHYLNNLSEEEDVIDATEYASVNNILAITDLMITDYSSLLFDYSILKKPAILYQYDREEYEENRSFMFDMEEYLDQSYIVFDEAMLYERLKCADEIGDSLYEIRKTFYPHQHEHATAELVNKLDLDTSEREIEEVIFLLNDLNEIGGVHGFVLNLAREFKTKYNAKIILIGNNEFNTNKDKPYVFDGQGYVDIKLSEENNRGIVNSILKSTNGYIITCQYGAQTVFQKYLKNKKALLMFHGDTKDIVNRNIYTVHLDGYNEGAVNNYRRLILLTKSNWELLSEYLVESVREKTIYIENGQDFSDEKNFYQENGQFAIVSRLDRDKNPLDVIDIFADKNLNSSYHLHIYGDGALKGEMEEKVIEAGIGDRVTFHGFVSDKEEIYRDKQGIISTSLTDGLPLTLIESIKYGIPVYVYDSFTACKDIVSDQVGYRIETRNISAFVEALNHPFDMKYFDREGTKERFSNDVVTAKWKELFDELDEEVAQEERIRQEELANKTPNKKSRKKRKKKQSISRRIKNKLRNSGLFKDNLKYAELSVKWRNIKSGFNRENHPLVSIIMPYYNNRMTVEQAVRSVERSGYENYELLLVNDGSEDNPMDLLGSYKKVRYFYKENGGAASARNLGLREAKGEYVLFLDSDDILYPGALNKLVDYATKHELSMVSGRTIRRYVENGKEEIWYKGIYNRNYVNGMNKRFRIIDDTISTAKLYSMEMLRETGIQFRDGLYEDNLFTGQLYSYLDRIGIIKGNVQIWMVYGTGTSVTTMNTLDNVRARISNMNEVFSMHNDLTKVYYTRQYIRHQLIASVNGYKYFTEEEKKQAFAILRDGMLLREHYLVKQLIVIPSKIALYQSLLNDDFDRFNLIAEGYSEKYFAFYEKLENNDLKGTC